MKKTIILFISSIALFSCKPKQIIAETGVIKTEDTKNSAAEIIEKHYQNDVSFTTLYIKANAKYEDEKQSQNVNAEIRIKKDEKILISVRILGITMVAKALITPSTVYYYEKINNTYFEGDYALLSQWLGTPLDYNKVQNLFLGKPLNSLNASTFVATVVNNLYQLKSKGNNTIEEEYYFEGENYLLKQEQIAQPLANRNVQIQYSDYRKENGVILPSTIGVVAKSKNTVTIDLTYKNVTVNEDFNFPYNVPEGFERIYLKQ